MSPGAWAFAPFALAAEPKVQNQAAMVALGRPGAGEALLVDMGFTEVERIEVPFVFEFSDPDAYARALASTGPAFEAIQAVGEKAFLESAVELGAAAGPRRDCPSVPPLRSSATSPPSPLDWLPEAATVTHQAEQSPRASSLPARHTPEAQRLFDDDLKGVGYVTNVSRLWAHLPAALTASSDLMGETTRAGSLSFAQRAVLVTAAASAVGDSYCSMAWGKKLAEATSPDVAAAVIRGGAEGLDDVPSRPWPTGLDWSQGTRTQSRTTMSRRCAMLASMIRRSSRSRRSWHSGWRSPRQ